MPSPGAYGEQWQIGEVTVTALVERHTTTPPEFLPPAAPAPLAAHRTALPWAFEPDGQLRFVIQALGIVADGRRILVDTCVGPRPLPPDYAWLTDDGTFLDTLTAAGFGRDDVDLVVCTHLHFDHVGWNTLFEDGDWRPTFRRAHYLIARAEYEHWQATPRDAHAGSSVFNFDDAVTPLVQAGVVDLVEPGHQISASVRLIPTPGHSPGHVSLRIGSGGAEALVTGDCAHHPVQLTEPDWFSVADGDRTLAAATRRGLVEAYADTDVLLIGTHWPPPSAGHLVRDGAGVVVRPIGRP